MGTPKTEYQTKKLINGHKLGKEYAGATYVAIPEKYLHTLRFVSHKGQVMFLAGKTPVTTEKFPDRYGRGYYNLAYFVWSPESVQTDADVNSDYVSA